MKSLVRLTVTEMRLFRREPVPLFFALFFPSILVCVLGAVKAFRQPDADLGGLRVIDLYVPISLLLALAILAVQFTPAALANYRERGVLRRMSTTPVPPSRLLAAQLITALTTAVLSMVLVLAIGRVAFAVPLPANPFAFLVTFLLCAAALFAIGLLVAAVAPSGKAGSGIGTALYFPLMFFAGLWTPREAFPPLLQRISDWTPLGAGEHALHTISTASWPHLPQVAILLGYFAVFAAAAVRLFRWQ